MKRLVWLGVALLLGIGVLNARSIRTQQNLANVEIKATKIAGNVYMLEGQGGNIGATIGSEGILIIDDQFAPLSEKIRAKLTELGEGKLKFVLNTHFHGDHTGGNANFGKEATIIAQTNVRKRLSASQGNNPPAPKEALPVITFDQSLAVNFNGEEIRAMHYPNSHTDTDSVIFFTNTKVAHLGDTFFNGSFPFVDLNSGGSVEGLTRTIGDLITKLPADVKIIPGHGALGSLDDLKRYHRMLVETTSIVRKKMDSGKTLEQIKTDGLPAEYESWGKGFIKTPAWIETVHKSLSSSKNGQ